MNQPIRKDIATPDAVDYFAVQGKLDNLFEIVQRNTPAKWEALRKIHELCERTSYASGYPVDWMKIFTPIEFEAWQTIRHYGIPFRPQYPVGRVFVDFADPVKKIALECDGKAFHEKNRDAARDEQIAELGWTVFRTAGHECVRFRESPWAEFETAEERECHMASCMDWLERTSDGLIFAISRFFYKENAALEPFSLGAIVRRLQSASTTFYA